MKKAITLAILCLSCLTVLYSQSVQVRFNQNSRQQAYAAGKLKKQLAQKGYVVTTGNAAYAIQLILDSTIGAEAYSIQPTTKNIQIKGGDERGLLYGCQSLAEDLRNGISLNKVTSKREAPKLSFRGIKFDLPWDTYRHSYALDLHSETCKDTAYWRQFLDMMADNRFNTLTLWNLHPYPYLIKTKNFPEASPFTDKEMEQWQALFHTIFALAKERSIDTYLVPFNIFVTPQFSKAHNVAMDNLEHHFFVRGDTSEIIKQYTRESVAQVLQEYPELAGFGLTLGEGMAGMTPEQREQWMSETIIEGMRLSGRKSKLIHRIPFSSTTGSLGPTSIETERLTRKVIEEQAALSFIEPPIWADLKFNWSHAHSTPTLYKVHGGKLYDTYFKPVPASYKITWTARNEDFFCLRWGVPQFVRDHINQNSAAYVGGYLIGSETYIPAKDYFTKPSKAINWKYAFERQWLFYKIWGRMLYNPATPDVVFQNEAVYRYGKKASGLLRASAWAGTVPLLFASSIDFTWDFSLYSEGLMALDTAKKRVEYVSIERLIHQRPIDTSYISVANYVKALQQGASFESGKMTPLKLAALLETNCTKALLAVQQIQVSSTDPLLYEIADIKTWSNLGLHWAQKIRAAVALETYRTSGGIANKRAALQYLQKGLMYWDKVIAITKPLYHQMPLVHYSEQDSKPWKENDALRFHWENIRPEVMKDLEIVKNEK
jgi:hypothetical protein